MPQEKYVFVYGAGISGCGVAEVLTKNGQRVLLYNDSEKALPQEFLDVLYSGNGQYICGKKAEDYLQQTELFVVSPGISMRSTLVQVAISAGI